MKKLKTYLLFLIPLFAFTQKNGRIFPSENRKIIANKASSTVTYAMNHPIHSWEGICKDVNAVIVIDDKTRAIEQVALELDSFNSSNANRI
jgi:L-rhamnose isomerase